MVPRLRAEAWPRCHGVLLLKLTVHAVRSAEAACSAPQLATVGYLAGAAGYTFPGEIAKGVSFASVNADGGLSRAAA